MANGDFGGGNGTELDPYLVEDLTDLNAVRNNLTAHYKQVMDIEINQETWLAIGNKNYYSSELSASFPETPFAGKYDGGIFIIILNTVFYNVDGKTLGLFGYSKNATFKNLTLKCNAVVEGRVQFGALCGATDNVTFENCRVEGTLRGGSYTGGFVGFGNSTKFKSCHAYVDIVNINGTLGGFIGGSWDLEISKSSVKGSVSSPYYSSSIGGFVGDVDTALIINSYSDCNLAGTSIIGGLAGYFSYSEIVNCYSTGSISEFTQDAGGLIGYIYNSSVKNSYCLLSEIVSRNGNYINVGDIYGENSTPFTVENNCYSLEGLMNAQNQSLLISKIDSKKRENYEKNGWDFNTVWKMLEGVTYPIFENKCTALPLQSITLV